MANNFKTWDTVITTWEDAEAESTATFESPESMLSTYKPCIRKTIGFYVGYAKHGTRKYLILATDDDRSETSPKAIGGTLAIPKGMVLKIEPAGRSLRSR